MTDIIYSKFMLSIQPKKIASWIISPANFRTQAGALTFTRSLRLEASKKSSRVGRLRAINTSQVSFMELFRQIRTPPPFNLGHSAPN